MCRYAPAQQAPSEVAAADHGRHDGAAAEGERLPPAQAAPFGWTVREVVAAAGRGHAAVADYDERETWPTRRAW